MLGYSYSFVRMQFSQVGESRFTNDSIYIYISIYRSFAFKFPFTGVLFEVFLCFVQFLRLAGSNTLDVVAGSYTSNSSGRL